MPTIGGFHPFIDFTNPKKTAFYLDIVRGTHDGLVRQGVTPTMVLVFIGPTVQYLTTEPTDEVAMEFGEALASIAESVKALVHCCRPRRNDHKPGPFAVVACCVNRGRGKRSNGRRALLCRLRLPTKTHTDKTW